MLQITVSDPCNTELIPPPAIASQVVFYGDPNTALDISVRITSVDYDFCVYSVSLTTVQPDIVKFTDILTATVYDEPLAIIKYLTNVPFLDPTVGGRSTIIVDYSWGLA